MSVFGGILLFTAGITVGGGAVVYHKARLERETEPYRRENERLKDSAWKDRLEYETGKAYRSGYSAGRKNPMSAVEELADTLEQHKATLKVRRE